jgi:hypothetical protein
MNKSIKELIDDIKNIDRPFMSPQSFFTYKEWDELWDKVYEMINWHTFLDNCVKQGSIRRVV